MKKYFKEIFMLVFLISVLVMPYFVFAEGGLAGAKEGLKDTAEKAYGVRADPKTPTELIGTFINFALGFLGIIFVIYLLWAGFNWMTAGGDKTKVATAVDTIQRAIIGLAVILASYGIANFVLNALVAATAGT